MKNKFTKLIIFALILIFLSINVYAHSASLTWTMNKPNYEIELYPCATSDCSSVGSRIIFTTASGYTYYMYYTTPYYETYHAAYFYKPGYRPIGYILHSWGDPGYTWVASFSDNFEKKNFCESEIGILTVSDDNPTIGDIITISTTVDSAFTITDDDPEAPKYCPTSHNDYFTSDINVKVEVYDSTDTLITTLPVQTKSIYQDDSVSVIFNLDTSSLTAGSYKLKLITDPVDSICDQGNKVLTNEEAWITVDAPIPPNTPPEVSDIPGQTITECDAFATFDLDDYVEDLETSDEDIEWSFSGNTNIDVDISTDHTVTLTYTCGWTGSETITFTAEDEGGLTDSDEATFTVEETPPTNTPPEINLIDVYVFENSGLHEIDVWAYAEDAESPDEDLIFTLVEQTNEDVIVCELDSNRYLQCTTEPDMSGESEITIEVEDPEGLTDDDTFKLTVQPLNDAPEVSDIPGQTITEGDAFATFDLDDYVEDTETSAEDIEWEVTGNADLEIEIDPDTHVVTITYDSGWTGSETITFTAEDEGGLTDSDEATFTVETDNTPPEIEDIPNKILDENSGLNDDLIDLWDYAEDEEDDVEDLTFTIIEQTDEDLIVCSIDDNRYIDCEVDDDETGDSYITVKVEDTGGLSDTDEFKIVVREWNYDEDDDDYYKKSITIYSVSHEDEVKAGDYLHINVYVTGHDDGAKTTVSIEELDIYESFNRLLGIHLQIPEDAELGKYDLKISVKNEENYKDTIYKEFTVINTDVTPDSDTGSDDGMQEITGSATAAQTQPTFFMQGIKGIATGLFFLLLILVIFLLFLRFRTGR